MGGSDMLSSEEASGGGSIWNSQQELYHYVVIQHVFLLDPR